MGAGPTLVLGRLVPLAGWETCCWSICVVSELGLGSLCCWGECGAWSLCRVLENIEGCFLLESTGDQVAFGGLLLVGVA